MEIVKKYILAAFVTSIVIFYIVLHFRIERTKAEIFVQLTAFDAQINDFPSQFTRIQPYINRLADHYGCPSDETTNGLLPPLKEFNDSVAEYCRARTDDNYRRISGLIERITESEGDKSNVLAHMVNCKIHPLTLSVFMLSPIRCTNLITAQSALSKDPRVHHDQLMLYLATLRQPNIFRSFFNFFMWRTIYDQNEEFAQFGNVFSYGNKTEMSVAGRLKQFVPELTGGESEVIEEILMNAKIIKAPRSFSLTNSIGDIIRSTLFREKETQIHSVIVVNTWPKSVKYFSQISEQYGQMYLKVMLIERNTKSTVLAFDKTFQVWTMFTEDGRALSMPRQIARLYYVHYGKYLIYSAAV